MSAVKNLYIDQGSDFNVRITIYDNNNLPWNLDGYTGESMIRKSYYSSTFTPFTVTFADVRSSGTIVLELSSTQTKSLEQGRYLYDVLITDEHGKKTRVLEGIVTINPGVT